MSVDQLASYISFVSLNEAVLLPEYEKANANDPSQPKVLEHPSVTFWAIGFHLAIKATGLALIFIPQVPPDDSIDSSSRRRAIDGVITGWNAKANYERMPVLFHESKKAHSNRNEYKAVEEQLYNRCVEYLKSPNHPSEFIFGIGAVGTKAAIWECKYISEHQCTFTPLVKIGHENAQDSNPVFIDAADTTRGPLFMRALASVFRATQSGDDVQLATAEFL